MILPKSKFAFNRALHLPQTRKVQYCAENRQEGRGSNVTDGRAICYLSWMSDTHFMALIQCGLMRRRLLSLLTVLYIIYHFTSLWLQFPHM